MILFLDSNIVIDVILERQPHATNSAAVYELAASKVFDGVLCGAAVTDIWYVARRSIGHERVHEAVSALLRDVDVFPVRLEEYLWALRSGRRDFEDAVVMACAVSARADAIVTRDRTGFAGSPVPVWSPAEALQVLRP